MAHAFKNLFLTLQRMLGDAPYGTSRTYEATSRLGDGLASRISVRQFHFAADAPVALGGNDGAPDPLEYVLAALAACQEAGYRYFAEALDVPLDAVSVHVEGDVDLRGRFAVDPAVRPGFGDIVATVRLTSPASETDLRRLKAAVDRHCPMVDALRNPIPLHLDLEFVDKRGATAAA